LSEYERNTTPNIKEIAESKDGHSFQHAVAHSVRTPSSVPSILTGTPPLSHGQIGNKCTDNMSEEIDTIPEILSNNGYWTIGISENTFAGKAKNIHTKFDKFISSRPLNISSLLTPPHIYSIISYVSNMQTHAHGWKLWRLKKSRNWSFFSLDSFRRQMSRKETDKTFAYIHLNDTHHPYVPPSKYINKSDYNLTEAYETARYISDNHWNLMAHKLDIPNDWLEMLNYLYDRCLKYVDHCVGEIFDFLKKNIEDFCLIVTSDHGELLGEYDLLDHHSVLHDAVTHIPLVTHGLPIPEDRSLVQHSDLMKTILSAVGISRSQINGVDLRTQQRRTAYTQTLHESVHDDNRENYDLIKRFNPEYENTYLPNSLVTSARTKKFKLVHTDTKENLYRLDDETDCVKSDYHKMHKHLSKKLDSFSDDLPRLDQHESSSEKLNPETEKRLIDMGYL
jgi:uncharacterized sulfatase